MPVDVRARLAGIEPEVVKTLAAAQLSQVGSSAEDSGNKVRLP